MAHKKATGSTTLGRDSAGKRLGVKISDGSYAKTGAIIVRQRGTKIHPGKNVERGRDDTLYAKITGMVKFSKKQAPNFHGKLQKRTYVRVVPKEV